MNLRPSNLFRFDRCPGWWRVVPAPAAEEPSPEAEEGNLCHRAMTSLVSGSSDGPALNDDQAEACAWAMKEVAPMLADHPTMFAEINLNWHDMGMHGTADFVAITPELVHVVDWKFGRGEVEEAQDNLQLAAYAIMASIRWPMHSAIVAHVIQPRLRKHDQAKYDNARLSEAARQIAEIRHRAENLTTLVPGKPQCDWCPAKANCPELHKTTALVARTPEAAIASTTAPELARLADMGRLARKCADAIDAEVKRRIKAGEEVPGYSLMSQKQRVLGDIQEAFRRLGIPAPEFLACCKASLPKLAAALKTERGVSKADADRIVEGELADIIAVEESVSIKREAGQ